MIGYDTTTQLNKLRVTCQVAIQCQLPIQIKINPSAVPPNYMNTTSPAADHDVKTTEEFDETVLQQAEAYKQVVKDLARVLLEMTPPTTLTATESNQGLLRVHLSSWSGTEMHMNHLLQAFPNNLYIGLNATIGYAKHKHLHECTFAIPMDRCILESDAPNAIPSQLHNKKKVFCHSGCVLYTAVSIAEHKRHVISPIDVLRTTAQNTIQLYGRHSSSGASSAKNAVKNGLALRIDDVTQQAREQRKESLELQQQQQDVVDANNDQQINQIDTSDAVTGTAAASKLAKKKKKDKLNVIADDVLLAEIVSEMRIDNERQI
jgi:TatD related DNase